MKVFNLPKPKAPFEKLNIIGESITLDTAGKVLVLPSGNSAILPSFNEYVLNSNRLTIAESPFGGLKGAGSPDYAVGTLFCQTDGVYLTDVNGNNSTKTLTAGKQKELGTLSVDTVNHTVTQEFIIVNTATSNNPTVIDACDSTTGWTTQDGTGVISVDGGRIKCVGAANASGKHTIQIYPSLNLSTKHFISFSIECSQSCTLNVSMRGNGAYMQWTASSRFPITANVNTTFVLPVLAPAGVTGENPIIRDAAFSLSAVDRVVIGITNAVANSANTFYIDNITADVPKLACIELQTTNELAETSMVSQKYTGSAYETNRVLKLDSTASIVSADTTKMVFNDQTKFDDVYGTGLGRSNFPKGSAGETKSGTLAGSQITYSLNAGTAKRVGFRVDLPPSDGGRTAFNSVRFKIITYYSDVNKATNILPDSVSVNNGTMSLSGLTADNLGNPYKALAFNGTSGSVSIPDSVALRMITGGTINAWIYPIGLGASDAGRIVDKSTVGGGLNGYMFALNANNILTMKINNGVNTNSTNNAITLSQWQYVSVDFDSTGRKLYVNLIDVTSTGGSETGLPPNFAGSISIGNRAGTPDRGFNGYIKDVTYFNRILTPAEKLSAKNGNPPSDGLVYRGNPATVSHMGATQYDFDDNENASYGLQNWELDKPWLAIYDPASNLIDFYRFTRRPKSLSFKRDESGVIYELSLYPGNGSVYHGQITYAGLTTDSDSNNIPDCLEASINGSVTNFLKNYTMVIN